MMQIAVLQQAAPVVIGRVEPQRAEGQQRHADQQRGGQQASHSQPAISG